MPWRRKPPVSLRAQTRVANLQQTLRGAKAMIAADLRMAGYMTTKLIVRPDPTAGGFPGGGTTYTIGGNNIGYWMRPLAVLNPDVPEHQLLV